MKLTKKIIQRFAQIAVEKGFITAEQFKHALLEQADDELSGKPHRLIGRILLDRGVMTPVQIQKVLKKLSSTGGKNHPDE